MLAKDAQNKLAQRSQRNAKDKNPFMEAKSLDDLQQMEAQLYKKTWEDGKIKPNMEDHYNHQMELFLEAFATLFSEMWHGSRFLDLGKYI